MLPRVMEKVLVAGAGITGAVISSILRKELPEKCHVCVWDKARAAAGRMTTSRNPSNSLCTVDIGAQYISSEAEDYASHSRFYAELEHANVLTPLMGNIDGDKVWSEGTKHFMAPDGMRSLVTHFLDSSGVEVQLSQRITAIDKASDRWLVTTESGMKDEFDAVVMTMPVPQILATGGTIRQILDTSPDIDRRLSAVQYSSRFVLGLFYDHRISLDVPWCAKYFKGDPVIVFVSRDNIKRGKEGDEFGSSILVHTSVPFSLSHLEEDAETICNQYVLPRLQEILPVLPPASAHKYLKWRYSQVFRGYEGSPGAVTLQERPLLVCAGDGFTRSGFDSCLKSAITASKTVLNHAKHPTHL